MVDVPTSFYTPKVFKSDFPLSHGTYVNVGDKSIVFLAGAIPCDKNGDFVGGDAIQQTIQAMENVKSSLEAVGGTFRHVAKVIIYVSDMADVADINKAYAKYFENYNGYYPARCCFAVKELPKKGKLEIEATAIVPRVKF